MIEKFYNPKLFDFNPWLIVRFVSEASPELSLKVAFVRA